jgi:hypothetical protein
MNSTSGKFDTGPDGVIKTGGKFSGANDTCGILPPVSRTLVLNLTPVSMTSVANNGNNILDCSHELEEKNLAIC